MKSPEKTVADRLVNTPSVAQVLGSRIYPVLAPATAPLPFATWRRQSVQREMTLSGPTGMPLVTLGLELYAESYEAVRDIADRCRAALDGWGGSVGNSVEVTLVSLTNESDGFVTLAGGDLPPVFSVSQTYTVLWSQE